jgi:hypothetical protein
MERNHRNGCTLFGVCFWRFVLNPYFGDSFVENKGTFYFTVAFTTLSWILVTRWTAPVEMAKLIRFAETIQPDGWWSPVYQKMNSPVPNTGMKVLFGLWASALLFTYSLLFAVGKWLFGQTEEALIWSFLAALGFGILAWLFPKMKW